MSESKETLVNGETFSEALDRTTKEVYEHELAQLLTDEERAATKLFYQGDYVTIEGPESVKEKAKKVYGHILRDD